MFTRLKTFWKQFMCPHDGSTWTHFKSWIPTYRYMAGQISREDYNKIPREPDEIMCQDCGKVWYL